MPGGAGSAVGSGQSGRRTAGREERRPSGAGAPGRGGGAGVVTGARAPFRPRRSLRSHRPGECLGLSGWQTNSSRVAGLRVAAHASGQQESGGRPGRQCHGRYGDLDFYYERLWRTQSTRAVRACREPVIVLSTGPTGLPGSFPVRDRAGSYRRTGGDDASEGSMDTRARGCCLLLTNDTRSRHRRRAA